MDLSTKFPTSNKLYGFDISSAQFPSSVWLPPNVRLITHDAFSPFAEDLQGAFDVVHMRFMATLINETNFPVLMANIVALLSESR